MTRASQTRVLDPEHRALSQADDYDSIFGHADNVDHSATRATDRSAARWAGAFVLAVALHVGVGLLFLRTPIDVGHAVPSPAVLVDLVPVDVVSASPQQQGEERASEQDETAPPTQPETRRDISSPSTETAEAAQPESEAPPPRLEATPPVETAPTSVAISQPPVQRDRPETQDDTQSSSIETIEATKLQPEALSPSPEPAPPVETAPASVAIARAPAPLAAGGRPPTKVSQLRAEARAPPGERARAAATPAAQVAHRAGGRASPAPSAAGSMNYAALVIAEIRQHVHYPEQARLQGVTGVSHIAMVVGPNGRIAMASLISSSGSSALDVAALGAVRSVSLPPPPGGRFAATAPINFSLR